MKDKRPQFVKMNASREENPPPREVCCPDYRNCLTEAAFKNFCLDCSQCNAGEGTGQAPALSAEIGVQKIHKTPAPLSLSC